MDYREEEEILKEKLRKLEENYKEGVFSKDNARSKIESEIKKDLLKKDEDFYDNEIVPLDIEDEGINVKKPEIRVIPKTKTESSFEKIDYSDYQKSKLPEFKNKKFDIRDFEINKLFKKVDPNTSEKEKNIIEKPRILEEKNNIEKSFIGSKKVVKPSETEVKKCSEVINKMKKEMSKALIGQEDVVNGLITGLLCNGHVLLEGVPGIAKTLAIRVLGTVSGCDVKRVQFTVDMLPTDIIGITSYTPEKGFETIKGPIFANFLIADEINRAPPKTQSALMEGMQERMVTIGKQSYELPKPFFVMATENPIENAGVYPLPEAQVDRFLFKLLMGYPKEDEEKIVMESNMTLSNFEEFNLKSVTSPKEIVEMQRIVKKIYLDESVKSYILAIVRKTREKDFKNSEYISYGTSPRASIGLYIASKAHALIEGRNYVLPEDVRKVVFDVMRHRLILSYKATIQKISPDIIIQEILDSIKVE